MIMYSLEQQLDVLSPEQLEALKQELIKQRDSQPAGNIGKFGRVFSRAAQGFGEGALLGLQGRPISELSVPEEAMPDKYEELLRMEQLKNQVDPSRRQALRQEEVLKRKLAEQESGDVSRGTYGLDGTDVQEFDNKVSRKSGSQEGSPDKKRPPMKIKVGQDINGLDIFDDNPAYKESLSLEKEEKSID